MVFRAALIASFVVGVGGCGFEEPAAVGPDVFFEFESSLTDESIADTQIVVRLSEKTPMTVKVGYAVTGGSAAAGRDFNNGEGEVTFQPFEDRATITLSIVDDQVEEEEEDIRLTLRSPRNAVLAGQTEHRLLIAATRLPRVRFVAQASSADEQAGPQSFAVQLDTLPQEDVVVRYSWSGTAEAADHGIANGFLVIPVNQISAPLPAPITNDPTDEDDETIDLVLIGQSGAVVEPGMGGHVHTILDDDPPPAIGFQLVTSSVTEGATTATLSVALALASEKPITVDYVAMVGGSAGIDDFTLAAGTLTFPPGTTTQAVEVTIADDALDEDDETIVAALTNPINATLGAGAGVHTLTITDDDDPPSLEFQQAASTVGEATATHAVGLALSAPSGRAIQFSVVRTGTSTTADLTLPQATFTIPAGATTFSFDATIVNDTLDEDDETAVLTLSNLVNAGPGAQAAHTITIQDDDDPPLVRFDAGTPDRSENERDLTSATYTYRVVLSAASTKQVTVPVTVGGTAMANDFGLGTGDVPVVFQPGQTSRDVRVIVSPDNSPEANETVELTLGTPTNATNAADHQLRTHTIVNDD